MAVVKASTSKFTMNMEDLLLEWSFIKNFITEVLLLDTMSFIIMVGLLPDTTSYITAEPQLFKSKSPLSTILHQFLIIRLQVLHPSSINSLEWE